MLKNKIKFLLEITAFLCISLSSIIFVSHSYAASETYTYSSGGSEVVISGGLLGSGSAALKEFSPNLSGIPGILYTGAAVVTLSGSQCSLGLQLVTSSTSAATGALSAPAAQNGLSGIGGTNAPTSCSKSSAASVPDFNKTVAIGTGGNTTVTETAAQREINVTVYSTEPTSKLPTVDVTLTNNSSLGTGTTRTLKFNSSYGAAQTIWSNEDPGSYTACISPTAPFKFAGCQTVTKVRGQTLSINFGSASTAYNPGGSSVVVTVLIQTPHHAAVAETYGPVNVSLLNGTTGANVASQNTNSYSFSATQNPGSDVPAQSIKILTTFATAVPGGYTACISNTQFCSSKFTKIINQESDVTINITAAQSTQFLTTSGGSSSCAVDGIGWIVCPVITFLGNITDSMFSFLSTSFLETNVNTLSTTSSKTTSNGTYIAWGVMRSIANVAFVLIFLIIIISQIANIGVSNYGIKKMLPRLIVAAILVNVSFFICQIAVDLSNILGYSLKQIFDSISQVVLTTSSKGVSTFSGVNGTGFSGWQSLIAIVLAGAAGAVVYAELSTLIVMLIGALISILVIFLLLILRQMLIILLIVVAPLAFVAYILPNTDSLFKKWRSLFTALLLLFPIIGVVFGASSLASTVLSQAQVGGDNIITQIIAAGVLFIPLIVVPVLLKAALDGFGKIGATINGIGNKTHGTLGSRFKNSDYNKYRESQIAEKAARTATGTYKGRNPARRLRSSLNKALNNAGSFNAATGGFGAQRTLQGQGQDKKDSQEAIALFGGDDELVKAWAASGGDARKPEYQILKPTQKKQFDLMRNAGLQNKPTSHLATVKSLSESGKGSGAMVLAALDHARASGASETDIASAQEAAIAAFRSSGRGDAVADINNVTAGRKHQTREEAWDQVSASSVHREALAANSSERQSYSNYLKLDTENTRKALEGYDRMESRAQGLAKDIILDAARIHKPNATITNIQDAKKAFDIK